MAIPLNAGTEADESDFEEEFDEDEAEEEDIRQMPALLK